MIASSRSSARSAGGFATINEGVLIEGSAMPPRTSDISIILKDGLRGARYVFRKGTRIGKETSALSPAIPRLARLADSVFTMTEKAAIALLSSDETGLQSSEDLAEAVSSLLGTRDRDEFKTLFLRIVYRLAQSTLTRLGIENAFISAHEIAAAGWLLRHRHRKSMSAITSRRRLTVAALARFWATTLICLDQRHAIREIDFPPSNGIELQFLKQAPETYCLLILVISGATFTMRRLVDAPENQVSATCDINECIDSAISVVTARYERLAALTTAPDGIDALSAELEALLPFLP